MSSMANKTKATNDQVSTSSTKSRASSRQQNNSLKIVNDERLQDKKELQSLNERLANYFSNLRELESENANLQDRIERERETHESKLEDRRVYYEDQLNQLRVKLDLECQNSAKKTIDHDKFKQTLKEAEKVKNKIANDLQQLERKNSLLAAEVDKLKERLNALTDENERLRKLIQNAEQERNDVDKVSKKNLAQAEAANLRAISLESKMKALEEKIHSQQHFYEKELEEVRLRAEEERDELIDEAVQNEIKAERTELKMRMKRDYDKHLAKTRQELEAQHADELSNLREQLGRAKSSDNMSRSKLNSLQTLIEKLNTKIHDLNQNETRLNSRVAELQGLVELERNEKLLLVNEKDREIRELEEELNSKANENQQVVESNVQLKEEIDVYRNLLEEQEKSLESSELNISSTQRTRASSPGRRFVPATRKRKRIVVDQVDETTIVNNSIGPIAIDESTDQFIRLVNRSDKAIPLGNWELKRETSGDGFVFKFHKSIVLQPDATVTVYSVDADNAAHNPPVEIKMKKNWPAGGITTLSDPNKVEIAKWEQTLNSKRGRFNRSIGDDTDKSCGIM